MLEIIGSSLHHEGLLKESTCPILSPCTTTTATVTLTSRATTSCNHLTLPTYHGERLPLHPEHQELLQLTLRARHGVELDSINSIQLEDLFMFKLATGQFSSERALRSCFAVTHGRSGMYNRQQLMLRADVMATQLLRLLVRQYLMRICTLTAWHTSGACTSLRAPRSCEDIASTATTRNVSAPSLPTPALHSLASRAPSSFDPRRSQTTCVRRASAATLRARICSTTRPFTYSGQRQHHLCR